MTLKERVIVETYTGTCMVTGEDREELYKYWAELMGRPIYTHEIASKEIQEQLEEKSKADFVALCRSDGETDSRAAQGVTLTEEKPMTRHCLNCRRYCDEKGCYDCQVRYTSVGILPRLRAWLCRFYKKKRGVSHGNKKD